MSDYITNVTSESFDHEVLQESGPVLVDFHADWCGPCHAIGPTVANVANEHSGSLKVVKVDVDNAADLASRYGVRGIPTLMVFNQGDNVATLTGANGAAAIDNLIEPYLPA